ncbi:amidohydrolase [Pseudooceanicola aestuarii]|uniref:amidohydrolase n=1 Tax=Pseudooceanicola aestuarii TaxID=2697319 RepID=UPI0013D3186A|nr:amidohydrolase [Pseudooceanicola aestuarii]
MTRTTDFIARRAEIWRDWRRDLHAHPELGFQEHRTAGLVADRLRAAGWEVTEGIGGTGVVGRLRRGDGPSIGLRADMDALPMDEQTNLPHASTVPGVFHGCGHDGHTVTLLAVAETLAEAADFSGTVHLIFQPAEEGLGGGLRMVQDGLFDRFPCQRVYGFHNSPLLPLGATTVRPGAAMASADEFTVTFTGRGGHAALPHHARDCALALAELTVSLQSLVAREVSALASAVLSVTQIHVGTTHNVLAGSGWLGGTVRCLAAAERDQLEAGIARMARATALSRDLEAEVSYTRGYPPLINDADAAARVARALSSGPEADFRPEEPPIMAAEDFAYMLEVVPGAYMNFGLVPEGQDWPMVHNPAYDYNDDLTPIATCHLVALVEQELRG